MMTRIPPTPIPANFPVRTLRCHENAPSSWQPGAAAVRLIDTPWAAASKTRVRQVPRTGGRTHETARSSRRQPLDPALPPARRDRARGSEWGRAGSGRRGVAAPLIRLVEASVDSSVVGPRPPLLLGRAAGHHATPRGPCFGLLTPSGAQAARPAPASRVSARSQIPPAQERVDQPRSADICSAMAHRPRPQRYFYHLDWRALRDGTKCDRRSLMPALLRDCEIASRAISRCPACRASG